MGIDHYNYDFNFPIVKKERKRFFLVLQSIYWSSLILMMIAIILEHKINNIVFRIMLGLSGPAFLITTIVGLFYNNLVRNFEVIGNIIITKNNIKIELEGLTNEYSLKDIKNMKIHFYGSEGGAFGGKYAMGGKQGTENFLEFQESNGTNHKYEFFVEKEGKLRQAIITMENRNIPFKLENKSH